MTEPLGGRTLQETFKTGLVESSETINWHVDVSVLIPGTSPSEAIYPPTPLAHNDIGAWELGRVITIIPH